MLTYILRRLLLMIPVALGITLAVFLLVRLIPGDPARAILGIHATPALMAAVRARLGLDRSIGVQYLLYLKSLVQGDFGISYYYGQPVARLVLNRMVPTLVLLLYSTVISLVIAVPAGILAATQQGRGADHVLRVVATAGLGLPSYWTGFILILLLAVTFHLFPIAGYGNTWGARLYNLFLPSLTCALNVAPLVMRALRTSLGEALGAGFIDTARAKGLPGRVVLLSHALRVAILPALNVLGLNIGFLVGNTVLVENVFAVPGLGQLMISSIGTRDYPTIQMVTLMFGIIVVLIYLITDLGQIMLDPRVRRSEIG
ncbi:ABC transporter permease [Acidisoma cellulosilytica]|uniref:ABC transporter permease n=1 Tax=Acidisoma cellulosilyticum TaxID=2802395 RepID=A0A963Z536_9PROT|nr:ABC transporter permease [Acidisoma cellulosilyticum]MCB8882185.1 ABC transporter permease [Acidisoma cellulosilyticum]